MPSIHEDAPNADAMNCLERTIPHQAKHADQLPSMESAKNGIVRR
jgi:hypothetical protein